MTWETLINCLTEGSSGARSKPRTICGAWGSFEPKPELLSETLVFIYEISASVRKECITRGETSGPERGMTPRKTQLISR